MKHTKYTLELNPNSMDWEIIFTLPDGIHHRMTSSSHGGCEEFAMRYDIDIDGEVNPLKGQPVFISKEERSHVYIARLASGRFVTCDRNLDLLLRHCEDEYGLVVDSVGPADCENI